jgi:hypothetical protein
MFVFLGRLFSAEPCALIEMGKMCGAVGVDHCRFLVGEFDAAEKIHQACFATVTSSHNVLENTFLLHNDCSVMARNMGVKNTPEICVISHS